MVSRQPSVIVEEERDRLLVSEFGGGFWEWVWDSLSGVHVHTYSSTRLTPVTCVRRTHI